MASSRSPRAVPSAGLLLLTSLVLSVTPARAVKCWVHTSDCFPPYDGSEDESQCDSGIAACDFNYALSGKWECENRTLEKCGGAADCMSNLYEKGTVTPDGQITIVEGEDLAKRSRCRRPEWSDGSDPWYVDGDDFHSATGSDDDCWEPIYGSLVDCDGVCVHEVRIPQNSLYGKTAVWGYQRVHKRYCLANNGSESTCNPTNRVEEMTVEVVMDGAGNTKEVSYNQSLPQPLDINLGHPETGFSRYCCDVDFCNGADTLTTPRVGALVLVWGSAVALMAVARGV